jgi:hypothetical protein
MRNVCLLILLAHAAAPACTKEAPPSGAVSPAEGANEEPSEGADELDEEEGAAARPVESLGDDELEAECFRGRTEACDLLGH